MKLFKLLTTTAITTMAVAAMSVSASAAMTAKYVPATETETGKVTLATELTADQRTLLVLNNDVFGDFDATAVENASVSEGDIVQIDQDAAFSTVVVGDLSALSLAEQEDLVELYNALTGLSKEEQKAAYDKLVADCEESATYYVRVGGAATIETAKFTVPTTVTLPEDPSAEPEAPAYTLGDVVVDGIIDISDVLAVLNAYLGNATLTDTQKLAADVAPAGAPDGIIDISDVLLILNVYLGNASL